MQLQLKKIVFCLKIYNSEIVDVFLKEISNIHLAI